MSDKSTSETLKEHLDSCEKEKKHIYQSLNQNKKAISSNEEQLKRLTEKVEIVIDGEKNDQGKTVRVGVAEIGRTFLGIKRFAKWFGGFLTAILLAIFGAMMNYMFMAHNDSVNQLETEQRILKAIEQLDRE